MKTPRSDIARVIADRLSKESPKKLARQIAAYLIVEHRSLEIDSLMRDVIKVRARQGLVEAEVSSAHLLNERLERQITKVVKDLRPNAKKVILDTQLDQSLIGGLRLNVINQRLDLSLRAKLNRFKQLTIQGRT